MMMIMLLFLMKVYLVIRSRLQLLVRELKCELNKWLMKPLLGHLRIDEANFVMKSFYSFEVKADAYDERKKEMMMMMRKSNNNNDDILNENDLVSMNLIQMNVSLLLQLMLPLVKDWLKH